MQLFAATYRPNGRSKGVNMACELLLCSVTDEPSRLLGVAVIALFLPMAIARELLMERSGVYPMKTSRCCFVLSLLMVTTLSVSIARADSILGSASNFAVLGGSAVTNTGFTVIDGDVGVFPGTSITGFPPGIVNGTIYAGGAVAMQAEADALTAFTFLQGLSSTENLSGQDLGGQTLAPGVYTYNSSAQLTGNLTLNFEGLSNENIVFQIGSTLTTASNSMVLETNMGQNDHVYWEVGSSATLGTQTQMVGNIVADQSITMNHQATLDCGRALALNGAVTMDDNTINNCESGGTTSTTGTTGSTPEPSSILLLGSGILALAGFVRRKLA
jgi:hypothetical protein